MKRYCIHRKNTQDDGNDVPISKTISFNLFDNRISEPIEPKIGSKQSDV